MPFSRVIYIDQDDSPEEPPPKYFRLAPDREVRLRYGYIIKCVGFVKNADTAEVEEMPTVRMIPKRAADIPPDGRKVKGTIHWVSAEYAIEVRLLRDPLFTVENPNRVEEGKNFVDY